jgi:hypothetical protein
MSLEAGTPQSFDASYAPACVVAFTKWFTTPTVENKKYE